MADHNKLGETGEALAKSYLVAKGYEVLETNWKSGHYELDLVMRKDNCVVAVEVKTRSELVTKASDVMSLKKERTICIAVDRYLSQKQVKTDCRIDLLILEKKGLGFNVTHIKDAIGQENE
ncbi:MAG: YraN family protein [Vicingaceae bacterium]